MDFKRLFEGLLAGNELSDEDAQELMDSMVTGEATEAQVGGTLIALAHKGCSGQELASFAGVLRRHATAVGAAPEGLVDTCGTGGGTPSFNLSTAAAIVASAAGAKVAKHGNRAVTSSCGSADVLEALGVRISAEPETVQRLLDNVGLCFLFAPNYHPALKNVGKVRKELGVRTVFNQLGPLANPAGAKRQMIGVYHDSLLEPMAEALRLLGTERAMVVRGEDGLDEISPRAMTHIFLVADGGVSRGELSPADFGVSGVGEADLAPGASAEENAEILRQAISDADSPRCSAVIPNAAVAIWLAGLAKDHREAADRAREAVRSGRAMRKLEELVEATQAA